MSEIINEITTEKVKMFSEKIAKIKAELAKASVDVSAVRPYLSFDLPLDVSGTESTECFIGVLPATTDLEATGKELYRAGAVAHLIGNDKNGIYAAYFCHRSDSAAVSSLLSSYGFLKASFPGIRTTAKEYLRNTQKLAKTLNEEDARLKDEIASLARVSGEIEVLYDVEATELEATLQKQKLVATDSVALISAWIPAPQ